MKISDFFQGTLGANLTNSRWSWGAFNPTTNQLFLRVWEDQLEIVSGIERISILRTKRSGKSAGYPERKRHIEELKKGAEGYGVLCSAKETQSGGREIAKFDQNLLLKFGKIIKNNDCVYAHIIDRVLVEKLSHRKTAHSTIVPDLKSINNNRDITTRETLANARVGQGAFRVQVLDLWGRRCCVTGTKVLDAIRASHIKPWRESDNNERLDPNNGLPLVATLDALFDAGLITFSANGILLTSNQLKKSEITLLRLTKQRL